MRRTLMIDSDLFLNHWLLGGALDAPDATVPEMHRLWTMRVCRLMKERYPQESLFYGFLGLTPLVLIVDEYSAEAILRSNEFITKSFGYQFFVPWLGEGVLISTNKKWKTRRRLLTASFHYKILENFCSSI